jgi:hypothetical protein
MPLRRPQRAGRRLAFGLTHGFRFSSVLADLGLPQLMAERGRL